MAQTRPPPDYFGTGVDLQGLGAKAPIFPDLTQRRRSAGIKTPTRVELDKDLGFPGPGGQLPRVGTKFEPDPYEDVLLRKIYPDCQGRLRAGHGGPEPIWSPDAVLMDMVAHLQLDMHEMRAEFWRFQTPGGRNSPGHPRQVTFTSPKFPRFVVVASWVQYRQVFGWDDATAALQLLSHMEGDALNVAFLVPESRRVSRLGQVGALTAHYVITSIK